MDSNQRETTTLLLDLSIADALTLAEVLDLVRANCVFQSIVLGDLQFGGLAYRMLNSAIDPIITQLEEGLESLGVR